jgi:hypothetical protein
MGSVVALFGDSQIARLAVSNLTRRAEDFGISGDRLEWLQQSLPARGSLDLTTALDHVL